MTNQINCLIVDDEPIARDILTSYCAYLPFIYVAGQCSNALEAKAIMEQIHIDLLFLDIHLPVLDGVNFYKTLKNPPQVIFTTAYKEYAAEAFGIDACDYLVKPFLLNRFIIAVDKAKERMATNGKSKDVSVAPEITDSFFVKTEGKIYKIRYTELLYAEAQGNYTKLVMVNNTISPNMAFVNIEKLLPPSMFVRVHRSYIINHTQIAHIESNRVYIRHNEIPIGSFYKDQFLKQLGL
jgi:DNA-binding LytR/AlgR family response regulator